MKIIGKNFGRHLNINILRSFIYTNKNKFNKDKTYPFYKDTIRTKI